MLVPLTALAAPQTAYVSAFNQLYKLDLDTAHAEPIGTGIGFNDVEAIAFGPNGVLYGIADGTVGLGSSSTDFLIRIDTSTGAGTLVGHLSALEQQGPNGQLDYGLAFTCDGKLWASSDTTGRFWEINPSSATTREVGNTGLPLSDVSARGNQLFAIGVTRGFDDPNQQALYRLDPTTAAATRVGSLGVPDILSSVGMDFDANGQLWATLDSQPPDINRPSRLARINPETGQATVIGSINGIIDNLSARALAIGPAGACSGNGPAGSGDPAMVPGPGIPALLVLGLVAGLSGARRLRPRPTR
ncbi:MAG TPA: hypothetical protein VFN29_12545 [Chiayiivirga sp.]|nr:hypothetical protein [Chiayiivirga sp.]